ncbi:MAG TPA: PASTA domain-containing protein [Gaiellaceae bacterium]
MTIDPGGSDGWGEEPTAVAPPPPPPVAPPPGTEPGNGIGLGMLLTIAVLAAAAAAIAAILLTRHHSKHTGATTVVVTTTAAGTTTTSGQKQLRLPVPDLAGQSGQSAVTGLRNAGFRVVTATVPSTQPRGTVVAQNPTGGASAARGSTVRVNLSNGTKATTTVPATTHAATTAPATTAQQTTTQQTTTQQPTTAAPATSSVPSLSGELQPAVQQLDGAGYVASVAYVPSNEPLGTVVAQSPQGGASAPTHSQVTVNVSSGPNANQVETVPNVVGQKIPQAVPALQHAGLRLIFLRRAVSDRAQAGVIVAQTPAPGSHAPKNAQVLVYMGAFKG